MATRLTPAALDAARRNHDEEEATFERLRHVKHETRTQVKARTRRAKSNRQLANAKARRAASE